MWSDGILFGIRGTTGEFIVAGGRCLENEDPEEEVGGREVEPREYEVGGWSPSESEF